jgi:5-methylthioadenosine/S-adenosylhomocysteine deaminase
VESLKIISNGHVLTCDPVNRAGKFNLLIRDGRIAEISRRADDFASLHPYATVIDASGKLVIPGFVNAHFHSESLLMRECTDGVHFSLWRELLREVTQKLISPSSAEDIRTLYLVSFYSHLKSGTTCVGEFPPPVDGRALVNLLQAIDRTAVRGVVTLQNWDHISQAKDLGPRRPRFVVNLGRAEDFTVYSLENIVRAARELQVPLLVHLAEQRDEVDVVRRNFQRSPLTVLRDFNALNPGTVLVHLNHAPLHDCELAAERSLNVVLCARSAAFKQSGYSTLRHLLSRPTNVSIGTDWANVDMVEEMKFLYQLPLLIPGIEPLTPIDIVRMATINGARALGLADEIGSIEEGKRADLVFVDLSDFRLPCVGEAPDARKLASLLVRSLTAANLSDVMINGEFYVTTGRLMTIDEEEIESRKRDLVKRFLPEALKQTSPHAANRPETKSKLIPFVSEPRASDRGNGSYEEGFAVVKKSSEVPAAHVNLSIPSPNVVPESKRDKSAISPELSKDVKRVFGEDDDF